MIFILIEPVTSLFATTSSRSSSFLWLTIIFLSGCQSEHQKSLKESNQIQFSANSHAIVEKVPGKKNVLDAVAVDNSKNKKNSPASYKVDPTEKQHLEAPASQRVKNLTTNYKEIIQNPVKKIGVLLPLSQNSVGEGRAFLDAIQLALFEAAKDNVELIIIAVSYTHLTLPTILRV